MGILWKSCSRKEVPGNGFSFGGGDLYAWPKSNPLWVFQNKWRILEVDDNVPYIVYVSTDSFSMICSRLIFTRRIAVRIGQERTYFSAIRNLDSSRSSQIKVLDCYSYSLIEIIVSTNKHLAKIFRKQYISDVTMI